MASVQIEKLRKYKTRVPKNTKAFVFETPDDEVKLHQLCMIVNKRGGAKSTTAISKLKDLEEQGFADRVFIVSPTAQSNYNLYHTLRNIREEDIYESTDPRVLDDIEEKIREEGEAWHQYLEKVKKHKKLIAYINSKHKNLVEVNKIWESMGWDEDLLEMPQSRYGHKPCMHILLDDCQQTAIMSVSKNSRFSELCLRHRHIGSKLGEQIGCSLWILAQNYLSQGHGVPACIRGNVTMLLFGKTKDQKTFDKIAQEMANDIPPDILKQAYKTAIQCEFDYLTIDMHPKEPKYRFRRNWNELLLIGGNTEEN